VTAFVVSRLLAVTVVVVADAVRHQRVAFRALTLFDGEWYRLITLHGYGPPPVPGRQSPWPFFPLLPALAHAGTWFHVDARLTMVVVSNAAFLAGLAGLHRLCRRCYGITVADRVVWVTALFPASFVFSMAYPDALLLAGSVWALVLVGEDRPVVAGVATLVATMARPNGILVVVLVSAELVVAGRRAGTGPAVIARRVAAATGPALAAFLLWCLWVRSQTGDAIAFFTAKQAWHEVTIVDLVLHYPEHALPHAACVAVVAVALVAERRHLPASWSVFALLWLAPPLLLGAVGLGRYVNECVPAMVALALFLGRFDRALLRVALVVSAVGLGLFAWLVAGAGYVP